MAENNNRAEEIKELLKEESIDATIEEGYAKTGSTIDLPGMTRRYTTRGVDVTDPDLALNANDYHFEEPYMDEYIVPDDYYKTPELGDYYIGAVDDMFMKRFDAIVTGRSNDKSSDGSALRNAVNAAYYSESPKIIEEGESNTAYLFKVKVPDLTGSNVAKYGWTAPNNICVPLSGITCEKKPELVQNFVTEILQRKTVFETMSENSFLMFKPYGIECAVPPVWVEEHDVPLKHITIKKIRPADFKDGTLVDIRQVSEEDKNEYNYIFIGTQWHRIDILSQNDANQTISFRWVIKQGTHQAYRDPRNSDKKVSSIPVDVDKNDVDYVTNAKKELEKIKVDDATTESVKLMNDIIKKAGGEIYLFIDKEASKKTIGLDNDLQEVASNAAAVFNNIKHDNNFDSKTYIDTYCAGRATGIAYVKIEGKFINLAKALIADEKSSAWGNDDFKPSDEKSFPRTYDRRNLQLADVYESIIDELDDRYVIANKLFGKNLTREKYETWTVTIGDVVLHVPPTNINCYTETEEERASLLRASGSMVKSGKRTIKTISMTVYFCGEESINGYKYETTTPNGKKMTYYMNGLRALIAQFKFVPFLPIESDYINNTLGVSAVTFNNMAIATVPGFPHLHKAMLTFTDFDYMVYMPELAAYCIDKGMNVNWFSSSINWKVLRYYYQRCLANGNTVLYSGDEVNSEEYIDNIYKFRTCLQPMVFKSSDVKFYIANLKHLDKMIEAKDKELANINGIPYHNGNVNLSDKQKKLVNRIGPVLDRLDSAINDKATQDALYKLVDYASNNDIYMEEENTTNFGHEDDEYVDAATAASRKEYDFKDKFGNEDKNIDKFINEFITSLKDRMWEENGQYTVSTCYNKSFLKRNNGIKETKACFVTVGVAMNFKQDIAWPDQPTILNLRSQVLDYIEYQARTKKIVNESDVLRNNALRCTITFTLEEVTDDNSGRFRVSEVSTDLKNSENISTLQDGATDITVAGVDNAFNYALLNLYQNLKAGKPNLNNGVDTQNLNEYAYDFKKIPYDLIETDNLIVSNISAQLSNRYSRINLANINGSTPQFLGGEDVVLEMVIETKDRDSVNILSNIPQLEGMIMRKYRRVIPCCPLKIDCEFTRMLGVNEVSILNVQTSTVPGFPGLYNITLQMRATDRTMRTREALSMIEGGNNGEKFGSSSTMNNYAIKNLKSYFDMDNIIAKAELYPDLELPKLSEMLELGYDFLRYKFQDSRVYVDPDFYFIYPGKLSSQILRETVLQSFKSGIDGGGKLTDQNGASIEIIPAKNVGYTVANMNGKAKEQYRAMNDVLMAHRKFQASNMNQNLIDGLMNKNVDSKDNVGDYESWEICPDIRAIFLEQRYKKEHDAYIAKLNNKKINNDESTNSEEGAFVYKSLDKAREASSKIEKYLKDKPITVQAMKESNVRKIARGSAQADGMIQRMLASSVEQWFGIGEVKEIYELLNFELDEKFMACAKDILYAAACGATAEKEFAGKSKATNWRPSASFLGTGEAVNMQDSTKLREFTDINAAADNATEFGIFRIKLYTQDEYIKVTGKEPKRGEWADKKCVNNTHWLLDPYYQELPEKEIRQFKLDCMNDVKFCAEAYLRISLLWLKKLIDIQAIPAMNADVFRKSPKKYGEIVKVQENHGVAASKNDSELLSHVEFFKKNLWTIDAGKFFTSLALANVDGSNVILDRINKREYTALNEYVHGCAIGKRIVNANDKTTLNTRKMTLALVGLKRKRDINPTDVNQTMNSVATARDLHEKKFIEAAEDPEKYLMHSCHDMITYDARGRMLRAFPTFYMMFIDEGRDVGAYHLHDNFYNNMAISEFTVVKSRKLPADTATIKMTNFFESFATEDITTTRVKDIETDFTDTIKSIFSPSSWAEVLEHARQAKSPERRLRLRQGARIHLRAGYGSSAAMLPILFNGCIAEVNVGPVVNIVAQGDGVELTNPIMENMQAHSSAPGAGWFTNSITPKRAMDTLLTTDGSLPGYIAKLAHRPDIIGNNPFGIYHFGDKDFTDIIKNGETTQNIFEAWSKPTWDDASRSLWGDVNAPEITFEIFGKTIWDVANICKSVTPDFICGVAPFDYRSTLFIGAPRYYYAYGYFQRNGVILEKRKPYQQYHCYFSDTDIIGNGISASSREMKTNATGLYQTVATFSTKEQHRVGPLYVDYDIYPDYQKSMIVDTQLYAKGPALLSAVPVVGSAFQSMLNNVEFIDDLWDDQGSCVSTKKIAWRMTASALHESVKDMYCGDLVVLGDPSVKPHDRMYINDTYEGMNGAAEVKEVIHHMSVDSGFITTISPDCINRVDDQYELVAQRWFGIVNAMSLSAICAQGIVSYWWYGGGKNTAPTKIKTLLNDYYKGKVESFSPENKARIAEAKQFFNDSAAAVKKDIESMKQWLKEHTPPKNMKQSETVKVVSQKLSESEAKLVSLKQVAKGVAEDATKLLNKVPLGSGIVSGTKEVAGIAAKMAPGIRAALKGAVQGVAGILIQETIGRVCNALISNFMKNLQVLTIFPLQKYGMSFTAGMLGSKGVIYNDPSYEEQGALTAFLADIFGKADSDGMDFISSFFISEDLKNTCEKLKRGKNKQISQDEVTRNSAPGAYNPAAAIGSSSAALIDTPIIKNTYKRMQMTKRVDPAEENKMDILTSYNYYKIADSQMFQSNPNLQKNVYISDDVRFLPYKEENFFGILHELPDFNKDQRVDTKIFELHGKKHYVKVVYYSNNDGSEILDVPMLNKEAVDILFEIIRRAKNHMPSANASDANEAKARSAGNNIIVLQSALKIGDKKSLASTGYCFTIEGYNEAVQPMKQAIIDLQKDLEEEAKDNGILSPKLFSVAENGNQRQISVFMPKISNDASTNTRLANEPVTATFKGAKKGTITKAHDADTVTFKDESGETIEVRLYGIDAPENSPGTVYGVQPGGTESTEFMKSLVEGKEVVIDFTGELTYERSVGKIMKGDMDVNKELVEQGWAWVTTFVGNGDIAAYKAAEARAKENQRGIWGLKDVPIEPSQWRKQAKEKYGLKDGDPISLKEIEEASKKKAEANKPK